MGEKVSKFGVVRNARLEDGRNGRTQLIKQLLNSSKRKQKDTKNFEEISDKKKKKRKIRHTKEKKRKKKRRWGWVPLAIKRCEAIKSGACVCWDLLGRGISVLRNNTI